MPISVHRIALGSDYTQVVDKVQKKKNRYCLSRGCSKVNSPETKASILGDKQSLKNLCANLSVVKEDVSTDR